MSKSTSYSSSSKAPPSDFDAMLQDIYQAASTSNPQRLGHDLNAQDEMLKEMLQRYSNAYKFDNESGDLKARKKQPPSRRDLQ